MNKPSLKRLVLLGSVFVIASCGLVYELLTGTISAYLVGAAILQFSLVVGVFMAAMGLGAFLSQYVHDELLDRFVQIEVGVGFFGGISALVLYVAFAYLEYYTPVLYAMCVLVGTLIGMEIPIVIRLLEDELSLEVNVATVLGLDYLGALIASIAFPLFVLPYLGQMATAFFFGLLNVGVALLCCWWLRDHLARPKTTTVKAAAAALILVAGLVSSGRFVSWFEEALYHDTVVYSTNTPHQRLVLTKWRNDVRLYLNGNLQFSTVDEYRYHESLVHTAMGFPGRRERVLILGGGDGMAAREVLEYPEVEQVDLVDLDGELTELFATHPVLSRLNEGALTDDRVRVINGDAYKFLEELPAGRRYDRIIADFPDPNNHSVGKLYTVEFYRLVFSHLTGDGFFITQATAPYLGRTSFWCIEHTIDSVDTRLRRGQTMFTRPLHTYVPTFGDWGFVLASPRPIDLERWKLEVDTKYLTRRVFDAQFVFPKDEQPPSVEVNRLDNQILVDYYEKDWGRYNQ